MWRLTVAAVMVVAIATATEASWKWDESRPENVTASASTVTSSSSSTSTLSSRTTVTQDDAQGFTEFPTDTPSLRREEDPSDGTPRIDNTANDTEPRFIGSLKKKLCSVGLGINNGEFFECKNVGPKKKVRTPRDTKEDKEEKNEPKNEQSPRLLGLLGGLIGGSGLDGIFKGPAFVPSFGVNFGSLPTGGGYGPYGTPYGSGYGSNPLGLDLGPVSINPFVGFKVAKFDGRPVFNPSLDLLVTPNAEGVHAIENVKKGLGLGGVGGIGGVGGGFPGGPYPGGPYPGGPFPGGPYPYSPYPGGNYHQGAGHYNGGGYPGTNYPIGGLYPQAGGLQPSLYSPQTYKPPYAPSKPVYTPPYTSKPVYTPPYIPSKPAYSPPVYTSPATSFHRPQPIPDYSSQIHNSPFSHSRPSFTPSVPIHTPSRPLHTPSSFLHDDKPVEVHHHEHTHYHDHDHDDDYDDNPFNPNGFSSILRGHTNRGGKSDNDRGSSFSDRRPLSNSALSFTPSHSPDRFVLPESKFPNSLLDPRSLDSDKSDSGSSFKFPDK